MKIRKGKKKISREPLEAWPEEMAVIGKGNSITEQQAFGRQVGERERERGWGSKRMAVFRARTQPPALRPMGLESSQHAHSQK